MMEKQVNKEEIDGAVPENGSSAAEGAGNGREGGRAPKMAGGGMGMGGGGRIPYPPTTICMEKETTKEQLLLM